MNILSKLCGIALRLMEPWIVISLLLNKKWWFCFEYFPDEQPANIEYSKVPKNNLVLTAISKYRKYEFTIDELDEYSRLFDVDMIPVVYQGTLTETMKSFSVLSES